MAAWALMCHKTLLVFPLKVWIFIILGSRMSFINFDSSWLFLHMTKATFKQLFSPQGSHHSISFSWDKQLQKDDVCIFELVPHMQATQRGKNERILSMGAKILSKPRSSFKECDKEKKKFRKERCRDSEFLEYLTCPARETLLKSLKLKGHEVDIKM